MEQQRKYFNGEDIYQRIKDDIVNLHLAPGSVISENELAKKYSVSRTPIKSAFLRLMSEKFIEIAPQRGTYVTRIDIDYIRDTIFMRTVLEREIFCSAVGNLSDSLIDKLRANLEEQALLVDRDNYNMEDFFKLDSSFHGELFAYTGHNHLWGLIQESQVYYTRFRMLDIIATKSCAQLLSEHNELLDTLIAKDKERLSAQLHSHLHGNLYRLLPRIDTEFAEYFVSPGSKNP